MTTVNELIGQLTTMRDVMGVGDMDIAVAVAGEAGFTSRMLQLCAPPAIIHDGRPAVIIALRPEAMPFSPELAGMSIRLEAIAAARKGGAE